jgi:murein L,D-transpeptidase YafK
MVVRPIPPPPEEVPALRLKTTWMSPTANGIQRMQEARVAKLDTVRQLFASANVAFPPAEVLFRVFKREKRLEVWASGSKAAPLTHVTTYEVCYASGELGPKRKEGDRQVPEGFYSINFLNPHSSYYLSMQVSYPNASDRILGDKRMPGSEIMIHGNCVSIGCVAMMDERMQEIWVTTIEARRQGAPVNVHIFPARDLTGLITSNQYPQHRAFWENLKDGHDLFANTKKVPQVGVERDGRYTFR